MDNKCSFYFEFAFSNSDGPGHSFYKKVESYLKAQGKEFISFYKPLDFSISLPVESVIVFYFNRNEKITPDTLSIIFKIKKYQLEIINEVYETYVGLFISQGTSVSPEEFGDWLISNCISFKEKYAK
jgi:hypothetical protein